MAGSFFATWPSEVSTGGQGDEAGCGGLWWGLQLRDLSLGCSVRGAGHGGRSYLVVPVRRRGAAGLLSSAGESGSSPASVRLWL